MPSPARGEGALSQSVRAVKAMTACMVGKATPQAARAHHQERRAWTVGTAYEAAVRADILRTRLCPPYELRPTNNRLEHRSPNAPGLPISLATRIFPLKDARRTDVSNCILSEPLTGRPSLSEPSGLLS